MLHQIAVPLGKDAPVIRFIAHFYVALVLVQDFQNFRVLLQFVQTLAVGDSRHQLNVRVFLFFLCHKLGKIQVCAVGKTREKATEAVAKGLLNFLFQEMKDMFLTGQRNFSSPGDTSRFFYFH